MRPSRSHRVPSKSPASAAQSEEVVRADAHSRESTLLPTTTTLLDGLIAESDRTWERFDAFYRPFLTRYAIRGGLTTADADDVVQVTIIEFRQNFSARYRRREGRLRNWVVGILKRQIANQRRKNAKRSMAPSDFRTLAAPEDERRVEEEEWRRAILSTAMELLTNEKQCRLSNRKVRAFVGFAIEGKSAAQMAEQLQMTVEDVFRSKYLCLRYLKKCQGVLEAFFRC